MSEFRVVIYDSKDELWERERAPSEAAARDSAVRWSANNRSWRVVVRRGSDDIAHYRKGREYKPRKKATP